MRKRFFSILIVLVLILSVVACQKEEPATVDPSEGETPEQPEEVQYYPITITDDSGEEIIIEKEPQKVASAAPSNTEIIFALGAEDKLVGVTDYCNYPAAALEIEKIGGYSGPNLEKIIELEVDLLITNNVPDDIKQQLLDAGVKVILIEPNEIEGIYNSIELIGKVLNAQQAADEIVGNMRSKQKQIVERVKNLPSKRVFFEVWHDPLMSAGPGSFMNELINLVNGENIAGDAESAYPQYSIEMLIERNPQVYITADDGFKTPEDIMEREGYADIDAIVQQSIYFFDQDIISRPGPRIIDALDLVASAVHPEAYYDK